MLLCPNDCVLRLFFSFTISLAELPNANLFHYVPHCLVCHIPSQNPPPPPTASPTHLPPGQHFFFKSIYKALTPPTLSPLLRFLPLPPPSPKTKHIISALGSFIFFFTPFFFSLFFLLPLSLSPSLSLSLSFSHNAFHHIYYLSYPLCCLNRRR